MRAVIVSGGSVDEAFTLEFLQQNRYDMMLAADSGMDFLYRNGIVPDVIAGDFDSVSAEAYEYFIRPLETEELAVAEILRLNPMKDDTDTEFVIREAIRRGAKEITLLGATGTRLDHVLANVHLLGIGLQEAVEIELLDAHNRIRMITGEVKITKQEQFGKYVSLLPFDGAAKGVTLKGFKYPLTDDTIKSVSSIGISNEIEEETAIVSVREGILLMIEARD